MRRFIKWTSIVPLFVIVLVTMLPAAVFAQEDTLDVQLSPNTISLNSKGGVISLHVDINYSLVVTEDLELVLNEEFPLSILYTFADDRGDLVIKCSLGEVKEIVSESVETAMFDLTVVTTDGTIYSGTDSARVVGR